MKWLRGGWMVVPLMCTTSVVNADEMDPQVVIEGRQANLRDMGAAFKAITDELRKPAPVLATIQL
ncbi:MAG: hypothetical protein ABW171_17585, partial [Steroidobacter sp.]